jgi:catechol 2,3-dioxygenase-like lactoylglutathione lyase family enzyme
MKIQRLDHIALVCRDSKASREWYQRVFEMEWIYPGEWDDNPYFLKKGDALLALFQSGTDAAGIPAKGPRIDHFAFRAETRKDYEEVKAELEAKGVGFDEQDHGISFSIYLTDPDGIKVEVTTYDL